ncbi:regulator of nonsense transcripts 3B [Sipha flava]|uniref:Regulator of nonsense transcripts 3B n=1 Tax=Sipha flava TaxID=143950 RepID=A0A8B8GK69_9HEMI|nr:regulator of nonsense transcripts 3B [Sipha flava]
MIKENTEVIKGPEKVDEFLLSLFKALDRQKSKDDRKSVEKKVIVRRLPPTMTEERFLNEVSPLPEFNYMYFIPGDSHAVPFHHSRVYINFLKEEDLYMFTDKFDGYVFVDDTGDEYPAIVELAPYQRIPKKKIDKDPNWGKIHENPVFLEFKRNFEQKTIDTTLKTTQHFFESVEDKSQEQDISTPLLEYLAKQNDRQRSRVNQRDERRKKVFIKKQEKEDIRRFKKVEKEIFIKPKPVTKISTISKRVIDEKPVKDTSQKKMIKSYKDDSGFIGEKKKYYDESHKIKIDDKTKSEDSHKFKSDEIQKNKSEDLSKDDEIKKIEFKIKTNKLNNTNKYFDNDLKDEIPLKSEKVNIDNFKEDIDIVKNPDIPKPDTPKLETPKPENIENKTSGSLKHNDSYKENDIEMDEYNKKYSPDGDKKNVQCKRVDNRRQDSKTERRIRNKDRPAIEIYRPGMGRLSKIKVENDSAESKSKK